MGKLLKNIMIHFICETEWGTSACFHMEIIGSFNTVYTGVYAFPEG